MIFNQKLAEIRGVPEEALAYLGVPSGPELHQIYSSGVSGLVPVKQEERFANYVPTFSELFPFAKDLGKDRLNLAYLPILRYEPTYGGWEPQTGPTCTSHADRNAGMGSYCSNCLLGGPDGTTKYLGRLATENLYGNRGGTFEGSSPAVLAKYVSQEGKGGYLLRKKYNGPNNQSVDLSTLTRATEDWAARIGGRFPAWLNEIASTNKAKFVARITTYEEERDAHALGFCTFCGSGYSFSNMTDEDGYAQRTSEGWSHAMARSATDDRPWAKKKADGGVCVIQSWGKWNKIKGMPIGVKIVPVGSFWIPSKHSVGMLTSGEGFILGDVDISSSTGKDYMVTRAERIREVINEHLDTTVYLGA